MNNTTPTPWKNRVPRADVDKWQAFDRFPIQIKRALWDGVTNWSPRSVYTLIQRGLTIDQIVQRIKTSDTKLIRETGVIPDKVPVNFSVKENEYGLSSTTAKLLFIG